MEETQRAKGSHAAYRTHVTQIFKKVDKILETETPLTDPQVAKLTSKQTFSAGHCNAVIE